MDVESGGYIVERQETDGAAWKPITYCRSLSYAAAVAAAGAARHIGSAYRAVGRGTGAEMPLWPETVRTAC